MTATEKFEKAQIESRKREAFLDVFKDALGEIENIKSWYNVPDSDDDFHIDRLEAANRIIEHLTKLL